MSFRFNGSEGIVDCGSDSDMDNVWVGGATVMAWIYLDGFGENNFGRVIGKVPDGGSAGWTMFVDAASSGRFQFLHFTSFNSGQWASPSGSVVTGQWFHVCVRWTKVASPSAPTLTIDGADVAVTEITAPFGTNSDDSSYRLRIGNRGNEDRTFNGRIADLRVYGRLLGDSEISEIYAAQGRDFNVNGLIRRFPLGPQPKLQSPNTSFIDNATSSATDASSIAATVPDHQDGDLLVLFAFAGGTTSGVPPTFSALSGWTSRQYLSLPSTATTPAVNIWTRPASSEPASYTVGASVTSPMVTHMASYRGPSDSVSAVATATGTSTSPSSPTITPSVDSLILRVMAFDRDAQAISPTIDMFPDNVRGRYLGLSSNGAENGGGIAYGDEGWDDSSAGSRTWAIAASDQWGGISIAFPWGGGIGGLPCKDLSDAQVFGDTIGGVLSDEDFLAVGG